MTEVELTVSARQEEPSSFRLVATLAIAGMISGLALSGVYQITKPTIDANKARELREAVFTVVPGSSALQALILHEGQLVPAGDDQARSEDTVYAAYDDNARFLGYAIVGAAPGFQDTISLLWGYDPAEQRVIGMYVLDSRETPGLGDKIYKDASFVENFTHLAVEPEIVVVKGGRTKDNEVDAITGATISSKAVVKIINAGNRTWLPLLPPAGHEPPLIRHSEPEREEGD